MKPKRVTLWLVLSLAVASLMLAGCAGLEGPKPAAKVSTFPCAGKGKLVRAIAPEAKLLDFSCSFGKYKGTKSLIFHVKLKNVSKQPQRYRVNIFLDNGKAVGGLLPRKTKKGLVKPGATISFKYPIKGMATKPGAVTLIVKTLSK
jgi:hypothetical protein